MGLFNRNKNKSLFDKNIEPKCAYCEHGRPARSEGKILCPRCGIVDKDYSCKKFKYSPFLRIPERDTPKSETSPAVSDEPKKAPTEAPTPLPAANWSEKTPSSDVTETKPFGNTANSAPVSFDADTITASDKTEKPLIKKEASPEREAPAVSNINNKPSDNSEKIAQLDTVEKVSVSSIENHVQPKEINLPETTGISVSSIENKPLKRSSEEYLKNISIKTVSEFETHAHTVHRIPPETKKASLNDMG